MPSVRPLFIVLVSLLNLSANFVRSFGPFSYFGDTDKMNQICYDLRYKSLENCPIKSISYHPKVPNFILFKVDNQNLISGSLAQGANKVMLPSDKNYKWWDLEIYNHVVPINITDTTKTVYFLTDHRSGLIVNYNNQTHEIWLHVADFQVTPLEMLVFNRPNSPDYTLALNEKNTGYVLHREPIPNSDQVIVYEFQLQINWNKQTFRPLIHQFRNSTVAHRGGLIDAKNYFFIEKTDSEDKVLFRHKAHVEPNSDKATKVLSAKRSLFSSTPVGFGRDKSVILIDLKQGCVHIIQYRPLIELGLSRQSFVAPLKSIAIENFIHCNGFESSATDKRCQMKLSKDEFKMPSNLTNLNRQTDSGVSQHMSTQSLRQHKFSSKSLINESSSNTSKKPSNLKNPIITTFLLLIAVIVSIVALYSRKSKNSKQGQTKTPTQSKNTFSPKNKLQGTPESSLLGSVVQSGSSISSVTPAGEMSQSKAHQQVPMSTSTSSKA